MSYGLTIKNDVGQTFISPNVTPMNFIKKMVAYIPRGSIKWNKLYLNTGISDSYIVLPFVRAIGTNNASAMVTGVRSSNGIKMIEITYCDNLDFTLEVYLFANFVPKLTNYGLEIYNDEHKIVYNSSCKPLEIAFCKVPDHNLFGKNRGFKSCNHIKVNMGFPVAVLCTVYGSKMFNVDVMGLAIYDIFSTAINESACLHLFFNIKGKHVTTFPKIENIPYIDIRKYQ